jgi:hypothetical protein
MFHTLFSLSAEPASIVYIVTGLIGAAFAGRRSNRNASKKASVSMSFCSRQSREMIKSLDVI